MKMSVPQERKGASLLLLYFILWIRSFNNYVQRFFDYERFLWRCFGFQRHFESSRVHCPLGLGKKNKHCGKRKKRPTDSRKLESDTKLHVITREFFMSGARVWHVLRLTLSMIRHRYWRRLYNNSFSFLNTQTPLAELLWGNEDVDDNFCVNHIGDL